MSEEGSSESGDGEREAVFAQMDDGVLVVSSVRAPSVVSTVASTIPVATSPTLRLSRSPDVGVTDSDHSEELPKTKKQLDGDFVLKDNTLSLDLPLLSTEVDLG